VVTKEKGYENVFGYVVVDKDYDGVYSEEGVSAGSLTTSKGALLEFGDPTVRV
jgi:hypothetical protein